MEHPQWIVKYGYRNRNPKIVRWSDHSEIAKVSSDTDAKLIAAAPAMFELLQKLHLARLESAQDLRIESYAIDALLNDIDGGSR